MSVFILKISKSIKLKQRIRKFGVKSFCRRRILAETEIVLRTPLEKRDWFGIFQSASIPSIFINLFRVSIFTESPPRRKVKPWMYLQSFKIETNPNGMMNWYYSKLRPPVKIY